MDEVVLYGIELMAIKGEGVTSVESATFDARTIALMPHGQAWARRSGALRGTSDVISRSFARLDSEIDRHSAESLPGRSDAALENWERLVKIEEPRESIDDRRADVVARMRSRDPLSLSTATQIALAAGYESVEFRNLFVPFKCGGSRCGAKLRGHAGRWNQSVHVVVTPSQGEVANQALMDAFDAQLQGHMRLLYEFVEPEA